MKISIFLLGLIFIISCSDKKQDPNKKSTSTDSTLMDSSEKSGHVDENLIEPKEFDSLIFDSVRINDKIPLKLTIKSLTKHLGKPDSIVIEDDWECGNYLNNSNSVTVYYYGKSRFITSNGEALLQILHLSDRRLSFGTNDFKISSEISESELKTLFPKSYDGMIYKIKTDKNYGERTLFVEMIDQPLWQEGSGFIFFIENGKLTRIELWWFIC